MSDAPLRAQPLGDSAATITFGAVRSAELLRSVHAAAAAISEASLGVVQDIVPAYLSVAVYYDALEISYDEIARVLLSICRSVPVSSDRPARGREHEIPVVYDGSDLPGVAAATGLSAEEVVARHSGRTYSVDLIGFVPGFAYLSELDPSLHLSRRAQPRPRVPAGSVAIAGPQTAVYPLDTPGGWHILGHTQTLMFDPDNTPPALLQAGDSVRFVRVG